MILKIEKREEFWGECGELDMWERLLEEGGGVLDGVRVCDVDMRGLMFEGVSMKGVKFFGVEMGGVEFSNCDLSGSVLMGKEWVRGGPVFRGCDLSGSVLRMELWMGGMLFSGCDLSGSVFIDSVVVGGSFEGSVCVGVDFRGLLYDFCEAEGLFLNGYIRDPRLLFRGCDLRGSRFDGLYLGHSVFDWADLEGVSFKGCDFSVVDVLDSVDSKGDFFGMEEVYSEGVSFRGALLGGVDWEGANLEGVIYN